ncbi:MAG: response regulator [Bacteroidales bacterium]|nr:response regulator [Bacteroidales bacterium]
MALNALIVDDEPLAVKTLRLMVEKFIDDVRVVGEAHSVDEALAWTEGPTPIDVVFLDIEMPGGSGFALLEHLPQRSFEVVFVTAYETYAVRAFKHSALDYLLKPIDVDELRAAVARVAMRRSLNLDSRLRYNALFENIRAKLPQRLVVQVGQRSECVNLAEVLYLERAVAGTAVHRTDGGEMLIDNGLPELLDILDGKRFFRIGPDMAVNTAMVVQVGRDAVRLQGGPTLSLAPERRAGLLEYIGSLPTTR